MATDPRLSLDEKRSLQRRRLINSDNSTAIPAAIDVARDQGAVGLARAVREGTGEVVDTGVDLVRRGARTALYGADGPQASDREDAPAPAARPDFSNVRGGAGATRPSDLGDTARTGLTRIFKSKDANGNSVYTNIAGAAPAGAEERYYNLYGNRQTDFSDAGLAQARASIDYAKRGRLLRDELDQQAALDALPPEERAALMKQQLTESGLDRRAQLDRGLRRDIAAGQQALTRDQLESTNAQRAFDNDKYERDLLRTNPGGALQDTLGELALLSPQEQIAALSDPSNPRAARAVSTLRNLIAQRTGKSDVDLGAITPTGGLRRFLQRYDFNDANDGDNFTLNDGAVVGTGVNLSDILADPQVQTLLDAYRNAQINNRR